MTTLQFKDELTENKFSFGNQFRYDQLVRYGLYFDEQSDHYPFILKGGVSDKVELQYSDNMTQLRGRLLNTKKIKEIMDSSRVPISIYLKSKRYLIGKGFLSTFGPLESNIFLLVACIDGKKTFFTMNDVKLFVSKSVYLEEHKALHPAVKDLVGSHPGDVIMCNDILDYVSERIHIPSGGSISKRQKYCDAIVKASIEAAFDKKEVGPEAVEVRTESTALTYTLPTDSDEFIVVDVDPLIDF